MSFLQILNRPVARRYRLVDAAMQPHPQLDELYDSLEAAMDEALRWCASAGHQAQSLQVGIEVSTTLGNWRTVRYPQALHAIQHATKPV